MTTDSKPVFRFFDALRPLAVIEIPLESAAEIEAFRKVKDLSELQDFLAGLNDGQFPRDH